MACAAASVLAGSRPYPLPIFTGLHTHVSVSTPFDPQEQNEAGNSLPCNRWSNRFCVDSSFPTALSQTLPEAHLPPIALN
eukprot:1146707-Pelagomonas_calceolata.AAC.2